MDDKRVKGLPGIEHPVLKIHAVSRGDVLNRYARSINPTQDQLHGKLLPVKFVGHIQIINGNGLV